MLLPAGPAPVGAFAAAENVSSSQAVGAEILRFDVVKSLRDVESGPLGADVERILLCFADGTIPLV